MAVVAVYRFATDHLRLPVVTRRVGATVARAQRFIVMPGSPRLHYVVLAALASLPIGLSWLFGMARTATLTLKTSSGLYVGPCVGYWGRPNWLALVALLPLALFTLRTSADRLFKLTSATSATSSIPDLTKSRDEKAFQAALFDSRNIVVSIAITVAIHAIDMKWQIYYFWHARQASWVPPGIPSPVWDWTAWFLSRPRDSVLYWHNLVLVAVAYLSQFLIVLFAVTLIIAILRHNLYYLGVIYLRSRRGAQDTDSFIVLDFENIDHRFGMSRLEDRFNFQIRVLAIAGAFTLVSRFVNSDHSAIDRVVSQLQLSEIASPGKLIDAILNGLPSLFPTAGQIMFAIVWLILFAIILLPARVKLLPIHYGKETAQPYLREFIVPDSDFDQIHNHLAEDDDVTRVATLFSDQAFWPNGNSTAQFLAVGAFFVFS
jgi:hypothetical protein